MKIVIVGCGKVGLTLATQLDEEGHDITLIEKNAERLQSALAMVDMQGVVGSGNSVHTLQEAGIKDADMLIAVTDQDEINLLSCLLARKASECKTIARVRNPEYFEEVEYIRGALGISMIINPELATAKEIARLIQVPSAMDVDTFAKGKVDLLRLEIPQGSILNHMKVSEFAHTFHREVLICVVEHEKQLIIPDGDTLLESGDKISIILPPTKIRSFCKKVSCPIKPIKDVMIIGGSRISYYLTNMLQHSGIQVKIVERKKSRCEELSELLPEAAIIYGDSIDHEMLLEEGLADMSAVVSLTSLDESNLFLSLYAHKVAPNAKLITKNTHISVSDIPSDFSFGSIVSPKDITAEYISRYVRSLARAESSDVEAVYRLVENQVEALEFRVQEESEITDVSLQKLRLKRGILICCIVRNGVVITPGGSDVIKKGDSVIVVTLDKGIGDIQDIVEKVK